MILVFFFWVDERCTPERSGPPVFFWSMGARVNINADAVHLFFLVDGRASQGRSTCFFSVGRATRALRRYHVGAAGVAPHDDEKGDGVDATPPALQSSGAAANVADDTRCAPVR